MPPVCGASGQIAVVAKWITPSISSGLVGRPTKVAIVLAIGRLERAITKNNVIFQFCATGLILAIYPKRHAIQRARRGANRLSVQQGPGCLRS